MTTITCPHCQREHGLFYYVASNGRRELCYICDRVPRHNVAGKHGDTLVEKLTTQRMSAPFKDGLPVREEWSHGWAKKKQAETEGQLWTQKS